MTNKISKYFTAATDELFDKISTDDDAAQSYTVSGRFDWRLSAAGGNDVVTVAIGKANSDSIFALDLGAGSDTLYGGREHDYVLAGKGDDRLMSGGGGDRLYGQGGDDLLSGGGGRNRLDGGKGNDTYLVNGDDTINDNGGDNVITVADGAEVAITLTKGAVATLVFETDIDEFTFSRSGSELTISSYKGLHDDEGNSIPEEDAVRVKIKDFFGQGDQPINVFMDSAHTYVGPIDIKDHFGYKAADLW
jgi:Ca2+-binding RTX toxin-like protein